MHYITELLNDVNSATQDAGFEFDGTWVTDPTVSECGRFEYTKEESLNAYGISSEKYDALITKSKIKWTDFSYGNDACNSIGFDLDGSGENYVQLFAFASQEDADIEGLEVYGVTYSVDGDIAYDEWSGNDRDEAVAKAVEYANKMIGGRKVRDLSAISAPISNEDDVRKFVRALCDADLMYHFDDGAHDCLGDQGLTDYQLTLIERQVERLFDVCEDPFEIAYDIFCDFDPTGKKSVDQICNCA